MKRIRKSRAARILSWLLTVAMITPLFSGLVAPRAAHAQQGATVPGGVQTVIVIDFVNKSGFGGDALARAATDAVAVELASSARFDVLKRDEVTRAAADLGLQPPFDTIALTKIASQLGATGIVTGEVARVVVDPKASPKTVSVGLRIKVLEASSGDVVNGSAQIGVARARPGESDDVVLAQEAIRNAATLAVRDLLQYNLPEGIILYTVGGGGTSGVQVLINRGSRDGIKEGMELIVLREHQRVGRIRVTAVYPTDSEATVVENTLGLRPEDRVRAVFSVPDFAGRGTEITRARSGGGRNTSLRTLGMIATVVILGFVISEAVRGKQQTVTGVTAEAELFQNAPAVRITWRDNLFGQGAAVLEYHIWRVPDDPYNPTGTPVAAVGTGVHQYVDRAGVSFWDGTRSFLQAPFPPGGGGTGNNGTTATSVTPDAGLIPGPTPGTSYTYQVSSIIRTTSVGTGTGQGGGGQGTTVTNDIESTPVGSGQATPLLQPTLTAPASGTSNVNATAVMFTWNSVAGADQFVLEITTAANADFRNRSLIYQQIVPSTAPFANNVPQTVTVDIPTTTALVNILSRDPVFAAWVKSTTGATLPTFVWRIGARNSGDRPGPVDWFTGNPGTSDRAFRWIYSLTSTFSPAVLPPNPP